MMEHVELTEQQKQRLKEQLFWKPPQKPFAERNQSDTAQRKLKKLAKDNGLDIALVNALANFTYDFDPESPPRTEPCRWVENDDLPDEADEQLALIAEAVGLAPDFTLSKKQAIKQVLAAHGDASADVLWERFLRAVPAKHYAWISQFATYFYLAGVTDKNITSLGWHAKGNGMVAIARHLFCKIWRGGSVDREELSYVWCDLHLKLPHIDEPKQPKTDWLDPLLKDIEAMADDCSLTDLLKCCTGHIKASKLYKTFILETLGVAGVLRPHERPIDDLFIPEHRHDETPHFYANDWQFPMRWWVTRGGTVNRKALPD